MSRLAAAAQRAARSTEGATVAHRQISTSWSRSSRGPNLLLPRRGFQRREYGLDWYPSKESLFEAGATPESSVLVAASYEYEAMDREGFGASLKQARKYAAFPSHWEYWDCIQQHDRAERPHNLHEIFVEDQPRCLYFDLDGHPVHKGAHRDITRWLQLFVHWFFSGDRLGWTDTDPEPVVLTSPDPAKYSCHIVFPQIQFSSYQQQSEYMPTLLAALPSLVVDLEGEESVPILDRLVDRVPYSKFQLFRGPLACKLKQGELRYDTRLEPEDFFISNELTCFAGHIDTDYSLELPPLAKLLEWNQELRHHHEKQSRRVFSCTDTLPSVQDQSVLYQERFQRRLHSNKLDLAGLTPVEQFEACLERLHPDRAEDWWSWFRICGVTCRLLEEYGANEEVRRRIWKAHMDWSSAYPWFEEDENVDMVLKAQGRSSSGIGLLMKLVRHDNPDLDVRTTLWRFPSYHAKSKFQYPT
eukprot:TRINITY_DN49282_c0_g1_i1.p1 TRINITY_DN49282_c0_g1~~TRINITY_DN49282_c0_g1_i1.p1  ORF type:complete len:471 (-),score=82.66 TRINITY_DN49282_c0_g1_i1:73-1485(-)